MPVQYVARDDGDGTGHQPRTLWGRIAHGSVQAGDAVQLLPERPDARASHEVRRAGESVDAVAAGESAGIVLDRQLDVSRGDWIAAPGTLRETQRFAATLAWLDTEPRSRRPQVLGAARQPLGAGAHQRDRAAGSTSTRCSAPTRTSWRSTRSATSIVETQQPLPLEPYADNRVGGALIVVDPASNRTSGALLVRRPRRSLHRQSAMATHAAS